MTKYESKLKLLRGIVGLKLKQPPQLFFEKHILPRESHLSVEERFIKALDNFILVLEELNQKKTHAHLSETRVVLRETGKPAREECPEDAHLKNAE